MRLWLAGVASWLQLAVLVKPPTGLAGGRIATPSAEWLHESLGKSLASSRLGHSPTSIFRANHRVSPGFYLSSSASGPASYEPLQIAGVARQGESGRRVRNDCTSRRSQRKARADLR